MTSCTCASSILSVSLSNWATPQTPNKPQSSQNSTPCKSVSNLSEKLSTCICSSLSGKLSIYTSMSGKLNTYTFVSLIFVVHAIKCWWKQNIWPLYLIDCSFVQILSYLQNWNLQNPQKIDAHE